MRATFSNHGSAHSGAPIKGTFLPDAASGSPQVPSVLPRVLAVLAAVVFMRALSRMARHHGGHGHGSRRERRMEHLAQLHRDLHERHDHSAMSSDEVRA
jgi:uncharacterized membrane protein YccC